MRIKLVIFLVLSSFLLQAQELPKGYVRKRKVVGYQEMWKLKTGCLLVMLHSRKNQTDALRKYGREKEAALVEQRQEKKNQAIIQAFRRNYFYSRV